MAEVLVTESEAGFLAGVLESLLHVGVKDALRKLARESRVFRPRPARTCRGRHRQGPGAQAGRRAQTPGKKTPEVIGAIEKLLEGDRAGCPMTGLQWTRRTTGKIAAELGRLDIQVAAARLRPRSVHVACVSKCCGDATDDSRGPHGRRCGRTRALRLTRYTAGICVRVWSTVHTVASGAWRVP
ncbi:hypothetical protein BH23GEM9_BH23GEM9_20340 [soil metagenome]